MPEFFSCFLLVQYFYLNIQIFSLNILDDKLRISCSKIISSISQIKSIRMENSSLFPKSQSVKGQSAHSLTRIQPEPCHALWNPDFKRKSLLKHRIDRCFFLIKFPASAVKDLKSPFGCSHAKLLIVWEDLNFARRNILIQIKKRNMSALDIILEIMLHLCISFQFFLRNSCFIVEIPVFQHTALAITFQIIMDHSINDKIPRYRETECPFIIQHRNPVIIDQDICRNQIDIGYSIAGKRSFQ